VVRTYEFHVGIVCQIRKLVRIEAVRGRLNTVVRCSELSTPANQLLVPFIAWIVTGIRPELHDDVDRCPGGCTPEFVRQL
jgi:hypothetical protein